MSAQAPYRHRPGRTVAAALAVAALAAPAASARPYEEMFQRSGAGSSADSAPATGQQREAPAPTVTRVVEEGFDLGSAAIGAGGAAAFLLLAGAGASAVSHRHQRVGVAR